MTAQLDAAVVGVGGLVAVEPDCVLEEALDLAMQVRPVLFDGEQVVGPAPGIVWAILVWQPIASMVTKAPVSARRSRSTGIAVISFDLASQACWPSTRR